MQDLTIVLETSRRARSGLHRRANQSRQRACQSAFETQLLDGHGTVVAWMETGERPTANKHHHGTGSCQNALARILVIPECVAAAVNTHSLPCFMAARAFGKRSQPLQTHVRYLQPSRRIGVESTSGRTDAIRMFVSIRLDKNHATPWAPRRRIVL